METINLIKWLLFIGVTVVYYFITRNNSRRPGFASGLDNIVPTFWYFIFVIIWLVLFFVIL